MAMALRDKQRVIYTSPLKVRYFGAGSLVLQVLGAPLVSAKSVSR